jgi:signal transduction histidine kinase
MKKILVIDDEEFLRDMVRIALTERGYEVVEAADGTRGIELARSELPDLILCDVRMERVDGYLTLASLREEPSTASIPVILITGIVDQAGMRHGMELGADDYLPKPFTLEALYAAVEARLKKAQTARDEAEKKMARLRDNISLMLPHEMRTPLNGILSYAELLEVSADSLPPEEIADMGRTIKESGQRLQRLIENFLAYVQLEIAAADPAQTEALRRAVTANAGELIRFEAQSAAKAAGRATDLQLTLTPVPMPMSSGHVTKLVQELVGNALKFSPAGTPVTVALSQAEGTVEFSVANHGAGFTPEQIANIGAYMQFDRKTNEQQGAGLGLVIAKRISELHGGTLSIASDAAHGTSVRVTLPVKG